MSEHHAEIVVIKRKSNHEEGHHGGAWKIAFADFMTAMMAFFLVLWIINATDKDTKTVIARYFNPVKLENPARARKGVHGVDSSKVVSNETSGDQSPGSTSAPQAPGAKEDKSNEAAAAPARKDEKPKPNASPHPEPPNAVDIKPTMTETALFSDPYQSLDKIAGGRAALSPAASPDTGSADPSREAGATSVDVFRDPFKPVGPGATRDAVSLEADAPPPPTPEQKPDLEPEKGDAAKALTGAAPQAPNLEAGAQANPTPTPAAGQDVAAAPAPTPVSSPAPAGSAAPPPSLAASASQLMKDLQQKLGALAKSASAPAIDVKATDEGVLISLTDKLSFSMFAIGSAEPRPEVVQAMDSIAQLLKSRPGLIVLKGHTDARPYKSATYDNWRLSTARAQMAYYMLTRAGIPENRIERVEGHADRALRDAAHPLAAENRRIEILLREPKG